MGQQNFNMEDPAKQEQIRRGTHEYRADIGRHGTYVPKPYKHQEYPKMMLSLPKPVLADFLKVKGVAIPRANAEEMLAAAIVEWDSALTASIVHSAEEEKTWLKQNGK